MRGKGISYDTGFISKGRNAREPFDPEVVKQRDASHQSRIAQAAEALIDGDGCDESPARYEYEYR